MGSERRYQSVTALNLTPLIDIVFLLLVFFMLTAHFIEEESIEIDLPEATSASTTEDDPYINVILAPSGEITIDGETVTEAQITEVLRGALHAPGKTIVRLRGDQAANFGLAVKIIDAARNAGAESLDILSKRP